MLSRASLFDARRLQRLWRKDLSWFELPLWAPLAPAAAVYAGAMACRSVWWRLAARQAGVLTVSVGNLTVGGNGKTPFTLFVASRLAARGLKVGIVSRGYGGRASTEKAALVSDGAPLLTPDEAGDEPVMMAKAFDGPIAIARRRIDGIRLLQERHRLDAVVLDDAFQHVRLRRDIDLLLVNAERGLGNGWNLPAGPMRERASAAKRADAVLLISNGAGPADGPGISRITACGEDRVLRAALRLRALVQPEMGRWRESPAVLIGRRILAVSGLADSRGFYRLLHELEAELVGVLEYPDHHRYTAADWQNISNAARDADAIITTEKDLVKLERFPFARDSLYALRLEVAMAGLDEARLFAIIIGEDGHPPRRARV
ncbi:MAG: tetraacyldisaccharide 4'-kinase [Candidatus Binataceae bacterium]